MLLLSLFAVVGGKKMDPADEKSPRDEQQREAKVWSWFDRWPLLQAISLDEWGHPTHGLTHLCVLRRSVVWLELAV